MRGIRFFSIIAFTLVFATTAFANSVSEFETLAEKAFTVKETPECSPEQISILVNANVPQELALEYLKCKRIQEAIWTYSRNGFFDQADLLKTKLKQTLESSNFKILAAIGMGVSNGSFIEFENGIQAVLKPEDKGWQNTTINEVFFYDFDQLIGLNHTPLTVFNQYQGNKVSIQYKMLTARTSNYNYYLGYAASIPFVDEVYIIDYILGSMDRHGANSMLTSEEDLVLIDNGRMFGENGTPLPAAQKQRGLKLNSNLLKKLYEINEQILKERYGKLLSEENIQFILQRISKLKAAYPLSCDELLAPAA